MDQAKVHQIQCFHGMEFAAGVLTNIGGGVLIPAGLNAEDYAEMLFSPIAQIASEGLAVIHGDDDSVDWVKQRAESIPQPIYALWSSRQQVQDLQWDIHGLKFKYDGGFWESRLVGLTNLENVLMAIRMAMKFVGTDQIDKSLTTFVPPTGRMEVIWQRPFMVIDGLVGDLGHILQRSAVGAVVDWPRVPLDDTLRNQPGALQRALALAGGDDYELLFTAPSGCAAEVLAAGVETGVTRIGAIRSTGGLVIVDAQGRPVDTGAAFEHFRR